MRVELIRSEIQRLLRQVPFRPFILALENGDRVLIEHPENIAFDPRAGASSDFYVLSGSVRLFSTFEAVSSATMLVPALGGNGEQAQAGAP
jgi:hypothetical protein